MRRFCEIKYDDNTGSTLTNAKLCGQHTLNLFFRQSVLFIAVLSIYTSMKCIIAVDQTIRTLKTYTTYY